MPVRTYRYGDCSIATRLALNELPSAPACTTAVVFEPRPRDQSHWANAEPFHQWRAPGGAVHASFRRARDHYLIRFPHKALFEVASNLSSVAYADQCGSPGLLRHLFLDQVMPLALTLGGTHVLHASAVTYGGGSAMFIGRSGAGKSTIAAAMARRGARVIGDDCLLLEEHAAHYLVRAPYQSLRLWADSASAVGLDAPCRTLNGKRQFFSSSGVAFDQRDTPLRAVFFLDPRRSLSVGDDALSKLAPSEALIRLVRNTFKLDIANTAHLRADFELFGRLVQTVPCYRLKPSRRLVDLPALEDGVRRCLEHGASDARSLRTA